MYEPEYINLIDYILNNFRIPYNISKMIKSSNIPEIINYYFKVNEQDQFYLLKYLAAVNNFNLFEVLVKKFDQIDLASENNILLCIATTNGSYDVAKYLVNNGVDVKSSNNFAIKAAVSSLNLDLIKLLVDNGADICIQENYPLRYAIYLCHYDVVKFLIEKGADVNASNGYPLKCATYKANEPIINLLLKSGARVDLLDKKDLIPAIRLGKHNIVQMLTDNGVDYSIINDYVCPENNIKQMFNLLVQNKVDLLQLALIIYDRSDEIYPGWSRALWIKKNECLED